MTYTLPHFAERLADRLGRLQPPPRAYGGPRSPCGESHGRARHTDAEVRQAVERAGIGEPRRQVARAAGVSVSTLQKWIAGTRRPDATTGLR